VHGHREFVHPALNDRVSGNRGSFLGGLAQFLGRTVGSFIRRWLISGSHHHYQILPKCPQRIVAFVRPQIMNVLRRGGGIAMNGLREDRFIFITALYRGS
jgi:hypothetical protein